MEVDEADIVPFPVEPGPGPPPVAVAVPLDLAGAAASAATALAGGPPVPVRQNLGLVLSQALASATFAPGVSVRRVGGGAVALADERLLRAALDHLLDAAARAMPAGGHLALRASRREGEVVLEIADSGCDLRPSADLLAAQRLLAVQGGRLERLVTPGRGAVSRVTLPAAPRE